MSAMATPPMTMAIVVTFIATTLKGIVVVLSIEHQGTLYLRLYAPHSCIPSKPPILNLPTSLKDYNGCYSF